MEKSRDYVIQYVGNVDLLNTKYGFTTYRKHELYKLWKNVGIHQYSQEMRVIKNSIGNYVLQVVHSNLPTLELLCEMYKDGVIKFEKKEKVYGTR